MNSGTFTSKIISSWGKTKKLQANIYELFVPYLLPNIPIIPRGNARSYGDAALNSNVLDMKKNNAIISFDKQRGFIQCQSGILISEILEIIIPEGWFLPVSPGTKYITLGGAIAADVHGKNHSSKGCFSNCIASFNLLLPNNKTLTCSKTSHTSFFEMTCGGMGLTGVITEATIQLRKIKSSNILQTTKACQNLKAIFEEMENNTDSEYMVAWIDTLQKHQLGKGIVFKGIHSDTVSTKKITSKKTITIPSYFPSFLLNSFCMKLYNFSYFRKHKNKHKLVNLESFFHPLDSLKNWNRIYGKKGFVQYQFVIPKSNALKGITTILQQVSKSKFPSFLSALKLFGPKNNNPLSFPMEGYSLAMDFKMEKGLLEFLNELDRIVETYGGRIYLAKDACMSKTTFEKGYPRIEAFKKFREENYLTQLQSLQSLRLGL